MSTPTLAQEAWSKFLSFARERCSPTAFENWLAPIQVIVSDSELIELEVPNIFVQEYLLENYQNDLCSFLPVKSPGIPAINFRIAHVQPAAIKESLLTSISSNREPVPGYPSVESSDHTYFGEPKLNRFYRFDSFIEGSTNQFVKSAALGVATRPGRSYNPLFIHGPVGHGKTHLLHSIGHYIREHNKKLVVQCITTEAFINDLVYCLQNKSVDKMKRFYRGLDVLLVDDIQFLQNRLNFEEEFCNTFEALINQNKQIVIVSDKSPGQLRLSERMIARMEWGLVVQVAPPDLETRVAIVLYKAEQRGLKIPQHLAFYIAERITSNVRQLEGAINNLSAHVRMQNQPLTEALIQSCIKELIQPVKQEKLTVETILKATSAAFQVKISDLKGESRTKAIALPRHIAMYLAKRMLDDSRLIGSTLAEIGSTIGGRTHSTILHGYEKISSELENNPNIKKQVETVLALIEQSLQG